MTSRLAPQRTVPAPQPQPAATAQQPPQPDDVTFAGAVRRVYRFLHAKRTGLVLILAMAVAVLLGTVFMQAPDSVLADPDAFATWQDDVRPRYGGWTPVLAATGMFNVYSSIWFKATTLLLAASIIACTTHRVPQLWRAAMHPRVHVSERFFDHGTNRATVEVAAPAEDSLEAVRATLRRHRFRVLEDPRDPGGSVYADRGRFGPWGTVVSHLAFVVVLFGVFVSATSGFDETLYVTVGTTEEIGHDTGMTVEARSFSDTYHPGGQPADYVSELVLYQGGAVVEDREVRVNSPLRHDGVKIHQASFGIAAVITVTEGGHTLFDGGTPLLWTSRDGTNAVGRIDLPDQDLEIVVVTPASGQTASRLAPGELQVEIYRGGEPQPTAMDRVFQGETVAVDGLDVRFERERQYTGLMVNRDPGAAWFYVGSVLLVVGMTMTFGWRHRRIWVRVREGQNGTTRLQIGSVEKPDSRYEAWFTQFVNESSGTAVAAPQSKEAGVHDA